MVAGVVGCLMEVAMLLVVRIVVLVLLVHVVVHGWMAAIGWAPVQGPAVSVRPLALAAVGGGPQDLGLLRFVDVSVGASTQAPDFRWKPDAI